MGRMTLITGGARSGKSGYCQKMAEKIPGPRTIIATCPILDQEMRERVEIHKKDRRGRDWQTIEETINLKNAIASIPDSETIVVDCLTLWINNLLLGEHGDKLDEKVMTDFSAEVLQQCRQRSGPIFFVSNEVGLGIVPDNQLARRFRDLAGRCNQVIAQEADRVIFMVSGIAQIIKGE